MTNLYRWHIGVQHTYFRSKFLATLYFLFEVGWVENNRVVLCPKNQDLEAFAPKNQLFPVNTWIILCTEKRSIVTPYDINIITSHIKQKTEKCMHQSLLPTWYKSFKNGLTNLPNLTIYQININTITTLSMKNDDKLYWYNKKSLHTNFVKLGSFRLIIPLYPVDNENAVFRNE